MPPTAPGELIDAGTPATPDAAAELIDAGTPATPGEAGSLVRGTGAGVTISGTLNPDVTGHVPYLSTVSGRPLCVNDGNAIVPDNTPHLRVQYVTNRWVIAWYGTGGTGPESKWRANIGTEATPELAAGWAPDSTSSIEPEGTPVVTYQAPPAAAVELVAAGTPATPDAPGSLV